MEFYDVINCRRSTREFSDAPVPRETIERILLAGSLAPSWKNRQCWRFVAVSDPELRAMLGQIVANPSEECYKTVPWVIAVCAEPSDSGTSGGKEYYMTDCGIAIENMLLAAQAEGLGCCCVGYFPENQVRSLLKAPADVKVVALLPVGHAAKTPACRPKRPLEESVYWDSWPGR